MSGTAPGPPRPKKTESFLSQGYGCSSLAQTGNLMPVAARGSEAGAGLAKLAHGPLMVVSEEAHSEQRGQDHDHERELQLTVAGFIPST